MDRIISIDNHILFSALSAQDGGYLYGLKFMYYPAQKESTCKKVDEEYFDMFFTSKNPACKSLFESKQDKSHLYLTSLHTVFFLKTSTKFSKITFRAFHEKTSDIIGFPHWERI